LATLEQAMASAPLWAIALPFFLALLLFAQLGRRARLRFDRNATDTDSDGHLLAASLALLGLMIAFTFSLALSRYDSRRTMIVEEGNAISTAWLRATLAPGAEGEALRTSLKHYADVRLRLPDAKDRHVIEAETGKAQAEVWRRLRTALPATPPTLAPTLVTATTEMFDAAARRKAERESRIPARVLDMVSLFALLSAGIVGYVLGRKEDKRHLAMTAILFLLLTLALALILDLDRPWSGSITLSPQPVIDARAAMD
jgi:hypothetical protein